MHSKELVIASYDKNLSWLDKVDSNTKVTLYRKGIPTLDPREIFISNNVGRDVHSFFYHIYNNYDTLADYTFFAQDFPFDHWENLLYIINNDVEMYPSHATLNIGGYFGFHNNTIGTMLHMYNSKQFESGKVLVCESNGIPQSNPNYFYINLNKYWKKFFDCDYPTEYEFMPGGHFAITKEHLRLRSKAFYGEVLSLLAEDTNSPWNIERLECYMFNPKYTSAL